MPDHPIQASEDRLPDWRTHTKFPAAFNGNFDVNYIKSIVQMTAAQMNLQANIVMYIGAPTVPIEGILKRITDLGAQLYSTYGNPQKPYGYDFRFRTGSCYVYYSRSDNSINLHANTYNPAMAEEFRKIDVDCIGPTAPRGKVYVMISTPNGYELRSVGVGSVDLERGNYEPSVLEKFDHIVKDIQSPNPCGRIALFDGAPGTGKTYLIRALLSAAPRTRFIMVPASMVAEISGPSLIKVLMTNDGEHSSSLPTVLILEDADSAVVSRGGDNMSYVSSLLNVTDGILGHLLNIFVVATTNAETEDLDFAIMRPGRLCRQVQVGPLSAESARKVIDRLTAGKDEVFQHALASGYKPGKPYTVAELYRFCRMDSADGVEIQEKPKKAMGFSLGSAVEEMTPEIDLSGMDFSAPTPPQGE